MTSNPDAPSTDKEPANPPRQSTIDLLASLPGAGEDSDFARDVEPSLPGRKRRWLIALTASILALLALVWFCSGAKAPNAIEASTVIPDAVAKLAIRLEPNHPYLAEYRRFILIRNEEAEIARLELSLDSGGFARTQLYRQPDGRIIIQGYLDAALLDPARVNLKHEFDVDTSGATYLGAFDKDRNGDWKFMSSEESPEQQLLPGGG
ncbi:hypothetical protein [Pseudoduganella sp.]|uniref:hypothetical protein n=1 Tax=Pseudoduganella sp. TaxID=1880898 RepID=UPI0035ADB4E3